MSDSPTPYIPIIIFEEEEISADWADLFVSVRATSFITGDAEKR